MAGNYMGDPMRVPSLYNTRNGGFPSLNTQAMPANIMPGDQPGFPQMPGAEKPKAWGKGGRAWQIMGVIGDALQKAGGGEATFMPAFLDMQEQTRKERETQRKLAEQAQALMGLPLTPQQQAAVRSGVAKIGDFTAPNNDTINDYRFIEQQLGPDKAKAWLENLQDPMVTVPLSNGSVYSGPRSGLADAIAGTISSGPPKPVGRLTPVTGGAASNGGGNFR